MAESSGAIQAPRNEITDISELVKNLAPLFLGSNKAGTTSTTTKSNIDPSALSSSDQLMATLMGRATSTQQSDALVQDIMHRAAIAFSPVLADERTAGGYNSTTRKLLGDEAMARATQAAADAVLQNQQKALDDATQLQNSRNQMAVAAAEKTTSGSTTEKTPPVVSGKAAGIGALGTAALGVLGGKGGPLDELLQGLGLKTGTNVLGGLVKKAFTKAPKAPTPEEDSSFPMGSGSEEEFAQLNANVPSDTAATTAFGADAETYVPGATGAYTNASQEAAELGAGDYVTPGVSENLSSIDDLVKQLGLPQQLSYNSPLVSSLVGEVGDLPGQIMLTGADQAVSGVEGVDLSDYIAQQNAAQAAADAEVSTAAQAGGGAEEVATGGEELASSMTSDAADLFDPAAYDAVDAAYSGVEGASDLASGVIGGGADAAGSAIDTLNYDVFDFAGSGLAEAGLEAPADAAASFAAQGLDIFGEFGDTLAASIGEMGFPYVLAVQAAGKALGINEIGEASSLAGQGIGEAVSGVGDFVGSMFSDSIICSELHRQGYISLAERIGSRLYAARRWNSSHMEAYRTWARPIVSKMQKSKRFTEFVAHLAIPWIQRANGRASLAGTFMHYGFVFPLTAALYCTQQIQQTVNSWRKYGTSANS